MIYRDDTGALVGIAADGGHVWLGDRISAESYLLAHPTPEDWR